MRQLRCASGGSNTEDGRWLLLAVLAFSQNMACPEFITLHNGAKMPILGFGTWKVNDERAEEALHAALEAGYRHIDTATVYLNEAVVGKVISSWISQGKLRREDLFITTKLPYVGNRAGSVEKWLTRSLELLRTDYVDLYLVHFPGGFQEDGFEIFPRGPDGNFLIDYTTDHLSLWRAVEAQVEAGRTRAIGLSNFNESQVKRILELSRIKPANLQVEIHVYLQQKQLVDLCKRNDISVTAYSPLGSTAEAPRFLESRTPELRQKLLAILSDSVVAKIAEKHKKTPAQIMLRHIVQQGIIAVPKSVTPARMAENLQIFNFQLSSVDMAKLNALDLGEHGRIFIFHEFMKGLEKHPENPFPAIKSPPIKTASKAP